mgnify:CR=1 FL=1
MSYFSSLFTTVFERRFARAVSSDAEGRGITNLALDLLGTQGEVSGVTLARLILDQYGQADTTGKHAFFNFMMQDLEIDPVEVVESLKVYKETPLQAQLPRLCPSQRASAARTLAAAQSGAGWHGTSGHHAQRSVADDARRPKA